jgi:nucleotide-binding universal stress UspA family protein
MGHWLLLLNDRVPADATVRALRAALPQPWHSLVLLGATRRWRPLTSGVPARYQAERQRALREIWMEQTEEARTRLAELTTALRDDAVVVDAQFIWGDPVAEAHQLARALGAAMIVFPTPPGRGLLSLWPGSVARRLTQDAPCSVLLVRAAAERAPAPRHQMVPTA